MTILCPLPLWSDGHVSPCALNNYLGSLLPLAACLTSWIIYALCHFRYEPHKPAGFEDIPSSDEEFQDIPETPKYITTIPPRIVTLEVLIVLADITIGALLTFQIGAPQHHLPAIASVLSSVYLLLILVARKRSPRFYARLQSHSAALYLVQWLCTALIVHTIFVEEFGRFTRITVFTRLALFTALWFIHLIAPQLPTETSHEDFDEDEISLKPGRDETASLLSRMTFFWVDNMVWKAFRATLEVSDLYQLNRNHSSTVVSLAFRTLTAATHPLVWRIFYFFKYDFLKQGAWAAVTGVAVFVPAVLIKSILEHLDSPVGTIHSNPWLYVAGLLASGILAGVADCQCEWIGQKICAKLRAILVDEIYANVLRKRMSMPPAATPQVESDEQTSSEGHASDGNILNLMSGDAENVSSMSGNLYMIWVMFPVQLTIGTYLLYRILGVSGVAGSALMIALLPLNFLLSKRVMKAQKHVLTASDARIEASNRLIQNIRTIKYCGWESFFKEGVSEARRLEMKRMRYRFIWWSVEMTVFYSLPFIVTILTCFFYTIVWRHDFGTAVAFPALAIFAVLRIPLDRMAASIIFLLQAHVSLSRVENFLKEPDTDKYDQLSRTENGIIGFEDATLAWPTSISTNASDDGNSSDANVPAAFRLQDLQIRFREDELNIVCGPSGSGKSALLLGLLGEMDLIRGQVLLPHNKISDQSIQSHNFTDPNFFSETTAYCPQEPWLMNRSIRSNILLGLPFDGPRYEKVLRDVALLQDIAALDQGDQTLAGENGSRLSGGQKQRVALARALYSRSKYVLLDDCFSAVDSPTANHIFFNAIKGALMRGRTCILATHHTQMSIPHCDYVVMLDAGQVKGQGTLKELVSAGLFSAQVMESRAEKSSTASGSEKLTNTPESEIMASNPSTSSVEIESAHGDFPVGNPETSSGYRESKSEGAVSWSVIHTYLAAMGPRWYWIIVLLGFAAQQLASLGTNLWIKQWAFQYDRSKPVHETIADTMIQPEKVSAWYYLNIYGVICLSYAFITFLRDLITFHGSLKASSEIYERLLDSITHARLLFFDHVPIGQIINRFSKDVQILDQSLAPFSVSALQLAGSVAMVVALISVVMPAFLPVAAIISLAYYYVTLVYINSARDLKRIEAVKRSPLYQQLGETLAGRVSIRAYARVSVFAAQNRGLVDGLNQPYFLSCAARDWLIIRIGILGSLISFSTGAFVLWNASFISAGTAGLVLTYAGTFTENVFFFVQLCAIIQQNLNSVERIIQYTEIDQEPSKPMKIADQNLPAQWPSKGGFRFREYTTRYAPELEPVLKGIDFDVRPRERVAIVGRTGAGKSTLTLALIRGLEADNGSIEIDGVDISSVTLQQLRQAVTVVPQDPKLFDGTLRDNLDPLHLYDDEDLLASLRTVHLMDITTDQGLNNPLDQAADTLSHGQRQLLCIARALVRRSRVLVLDEATASIDHATDAAVQEGLRSSVAAGTTVLTIAHRLLTVADHDRVIVLDSGVIVEEGSVRELLGRRGESAVFRRMCEESGDLEAIERVANFDQVSGGEEQ